MLSPSLKLQPSGLLGEPAERPEGGCHVLRRSERIQDRHSHEEELGVLHFGLAGLTIAGSLTIMCFISLKEYVYKIFR